MASSNPPHSRNRSSAHSSSSSAIPQGSTLTQAARPETAARRLSLLHIDAQATGAGAVIHGGTSTTRLPEVESLPLPVSMQAKIPKFTDSLLPRILSFLRYLTVQIYQNLLLHLPSHYFTRVANIYQNAELTKLEVGSMISWVKSGRHRRDDEQLPPAFEKIKKSWESFIDSLLREWETVNIVSVLLLSAILTILQIDQAASYAITRYMAFMSLVCALMSLLYGCLFVVRFGSMKRTSQSVQLASQWAEEASRVEISIWWNVWVMLAMPATFLCWAIISFIACIMSFMWRSALQQNPNNAALPLQTALGPCIFISFILTLGLAYLFLIITTFQRWGKIPDQLEWSLEPRDSQPSLLRTAPRRSLERQNIYPLREDGPERQFESLSPSQQVFPQAVDTGSVRLPARS
ncbi:hypothetical protein GALMADRAFT_245185 [Galerina marginata CBS 339.88]|uniref:Uncharacterized protein n=1 Tax=Galerina marginata (strain CBS 339.88) TaxID=685588 RepID=A0A067TGP3_GALM3|nr:hypothetical protein GALMADRAFT_245185 [Galerina marginata CBS 339.88]